MAATKIKFSPSINIIRDSNYNFKYIATPNALEVFNSILKDSHVGIKSNVIIGAYGSGKSSFLLAFKQTLEGSYKHFKEHRKTSNTPQYYEFLSILGQYSSLEDYFAKEMGLGKQYLANDIIKALDKRYKSIRKKGKGFAIIIDEFGKFLEFASNHNPDSELYFIQQLAEWINDTNNETLFVSMLHQDFSAYSINLSKLQRQEWDKVKGRLKEVPFNEPVEQLLFLASERINEKFTKKSLDKNFDKLFACIKEAKAFPLRDYFEKAFAQKLYPFDILSAAILTLSLQKYGQNERSLFSFIESNDHLGINEFNENNDSYFAIPQVYDYLLNAFYSYLSSKYNPHYTQWSAIRRSLEKADGLFKDINTQRHAGEIIKLIGVLNIFATASAKLEKQFYINYAKIALGIKNPEEIISKLEKDKLIRYVNHSFRFILFEGTDLDIELAIDEAGRLTEQVTHLVHHLNIHFEFPFIAAKSIYYEKGTPRFFQFKLSEEPITNIPEGEVDGFINLIFSDDEKLIKKIEEHSLKCKEAILFGYYKNTAEIKKLIFEIQKVEKVKESNLNDKIATRELNSIQEHYIKLLNYYVLENLYSESGNVLWYFGGRKLRINNRQKFNQELSKICEIIYPFTPQYKNELNNKTKVSSQISLARKRLIDKLIADLDVRDLGFSESEFPPEKSIYLTMLRETGIHRINGGVGNMTNPADESFRELWEIGDRFLFLSRNKERSLTEFINTLSTRPFKLKQGFIDFWLPIFLLAKNDEYALYENDVFIPEINSDVLELINKKPNLFFVKAFDIAGIKLELFNRYRVFLNQAEQVKPNNKLFIQTIKPFLVFYRDLPEYSKKTNRLEKRTVAFRKIIAKAKDPEKAFFEDFPIALGFSMQDLQSKPEASEQFIRRLQDAVRELRTSFDSLLNRFEEFFIKEVIGSTLPFPHYKRILKDRFKGLKTHLLLQNQKGFHARLLSEMDDRKGWLGAIAQTCIGKPLNTITDEEEIILFDKLRDLVFELDNLCDISKEQIIEEKEEVLKIEITSFVRGLNKNLLRIPKEKSNELNLQILNLKSNLSNDKKFNIYILTKLLQELLDDE